MGIHTCAGNQITLVAILSITIISGDAAFFLDDEALDTVTGLFVAQEMNLSAVVDWETLRLVPNNPPPYKWEEGDRTPADYEHKEGKHEN